MPVPVRSPRRWRILAGRLSLLMLAAIMTFGATSCRGTKPRNHWWQFWRPKATPTENVYNPDTVILPPAPDVLDPNSPGSSSALSPDMGLPPPPVMGSLAEPEPLRQQGQPSELQTVYFDYDSADLTGSATAVLDQNAVWLMSNPNYEIQIEGHTDERGTTDYNLNLGDRRAKAVKEYLVSRGVAANRLHTISYGEERPIVAGNDESSWGQNRRAQFLVY